MGRVRIVSTNWNKRIFSLVKRSDGLLEANACNEENPKDLSIKNEKQSDFLTIRSKVKLNSKKRRFLVKNNQEKVQAKNEKILQLRKEKLEKFRINYIPLCSDEDWEMMSAFYSKSSKK